MRFFLVSLILVASLASDSSLIARSEIKMGTFATIFLPKEEADKFNRLFKIIDSVEKSLSDFDSTAEIAILNRNRYLNVSALTMNALKLAFLYNKDSYGHFDISLGAITREAFGFGLDEKVPTDKALKNAPIGMDKIKINGRNIELKDGVLLDFGGMGKGFAVDLVSKELRRLNIDKAVISIGGDIRCIGECCFGVTIPFFENRNRCFKSKTDELAISTSGVYRRFVKNWKNNHLIDVKNRKPQQRIVSLTLIDDGPNSRIDAFATAASTMSPFKAAAFLEKEGIGFLMLLAKNEILTNRKWNLFVDECLGSKVALEGLL